MAGDGFSRCDRMYIIDGHNLIPKLGGSLSSMDDELLLIERLKEYARSSRHAVEVFFDGAQPGLSGARKYGTVTAHFVRQGRTADEAIRMYLDQQGKTARNVTVVSSDRQVQAEARAHQAQPVSSEEFARELSLLEVKASEKKRASDSPLKQDEIDEWLRLFGDGPKPK
jgi:uncharacterized protein